MSNQSTSKNKKITAVTVHDVAAYVVEALKAVTVMKLHKLLYYSQAWSLVWDDEPLFAEEIQAWAFGPVIPEVYRLHDKQYTLTEWPWGDASRLTDLQKETIDSVLKDYGSLSSWQLSQLTHQAQPWLEAREGLNWNERGKQVITLRSFLDLFNQVLVLLE